MKILFGLLFSLIVVVKVHCQNCKTLDTKLFFKTIKFGDQVPGYLTDCLKKSTIEYPYYIDYRLTYDSLNKDCKKKYSDLFTFLSIKFSNLLITANKKRQIFFVELYSFFDDNNRNDSIIYRPPAKFIVMYNKLVLLYGKPSRIKEATDRDSLFIKELGMPRLIVWECPNISLWLRVNYGSHVNALNVMEIQIRNRQFELPEQVDLLQ